MRTKRIAFSFGDDRLTAVPTAPSAEATVAGTTRAIELTYLTMMRTRARFWLLPYRVARSPLRCEAIRKVGK
jgi:hypothetical protein